MPPAPPPPPPPPQGCNGQQITLVDGQHHQGKCVTMPSSGDGHILFRPCAKWDPKQFWEKLADGTFKNGATGKCMAKCNEPTAGNGKWYVCAGSCSGAGQYFDQDSTRNMWLIKITSANQCLVEYGYAKDGAVMCQNHCMEMISGAGFDYYDPDKKR
eukprot:gnl/TRDRNA2_/TRDRNA2_159556_c0_seq1.p2 gnl/TRDRNA2_/TRDRNA2_159556_c0~~gnl/TRDRNA2_/TRDRNA2_159556_c0_seq1.p2  ORF type:complete len:157 (+),score=21.56 gnl/TRDRNA2_/TRDRNA2_159556_c0_seq1:898-1368(+)